MRSSRRIEQVSEPGWPSVHACFDICPESPDGSRATYFRFHDGPPGSGRVVVRRGGEHVELGAACAGDGHEGARQLWMDDGTLAWSAAVDGAPHVVMCSPADGSTRLAPGAIDTYSPERRLGLTHTTQLRRHGADSTDHATFLVDPVRRRIKRLFGAADVAAIHPMQWVKDKLWTINFQHAKWSPDGSRFFVVFTNESHRRRHHEDPEVKSVVVAEADERGEAKALRYVCEFGHHPMWAPDGSFIYALDSKALRANLAAWEPASSAARRVLMADVEGVHPCMHPDMRRVVVDVLDAAGERARLDLLDLAAGKVEALVEMRMPKAPHEARTHCHPVWSRDGGRMYFNSSHAGGSAVYALEA